MNVELSWRPLGAGALSITSGNHMVNIYWAPIVCKAHSGTNTTNIICVTLRSLQSLHVKKERVKYNIVSYRINCRSQATRNIEVSWLFAMGPKSCLILDCQPRWFFWTVFFFFIPLQMALFRIPSFKLQFCESFKSTLIELLQIEYLIGVCPR